MSRRVSLPGADELFRTTGGTALQASTPRRQANGEPRVPPPAGESDAVAAQEGRLRDATRRADSGRDEDAQGVGTSYAHGPGDVESAEHTAADADQSAGESRSRAGEGDPGGRRQLKDGLAMAGPGRPSGVSTAQVQPRKRGRRPSGRERHDEKITVYVSAEELMDLEHARLVLRGEHGLAVDRGRIVREAVAVVLADLEARGDASILVRRLRGR